MTPRVQFTDTLKLISHNSACIPSLRTLQKQPSAPLYITHTPQLLLHLDELTSSTTTTAEPNHEHTPPNTQQATKLRHARSNGLIQPPRQHPTLSSLPKRKDRWTCCQYPTDRSGYRCFVCKHSLCLECDIWSKTSS